MNNDYRIIQSLLNSWDELPCIAHFERDDRGGTPDLMIRALRGSTAREKGRRFSLTYRIFPDAEGEVLFAADFFDELDAFLRTASLTNPENGLLYWAEPSESAVCSAKNRDGSHSYTAEYVLYAGESRQSGGGGSGSSTGESTAYPLPGDLAVCLSELPLDGSAGLTLTGIRGLFAPEYLTRSQPHAFSEGSELTAHHPIGRNWQLTLRVDSRQGRIGLGELQGLSEVTVRIARDDGQSFFSQARITGMEEKSGGRVSMTLFSPSPWLYRQTVVDLSSGSERFVSLAGQSPPEWSFLLSGNSAEVLCPTLTINGVSLLLADALPAGGGLAVRSSLRSVLDLEGTVLKEFSEEAFPAVACEENTLRFTADSTWDGAVTLCFAERFYSV